MKIQHLDQSFPFILIDNLYDKQELNLIWEELNFLCYPQKLTKSTIKKGAATKGGISLKNTNDVYLDRVYTSRDYSSILTVNRKIFNNFEKIFLSHKSWFFKTITINCDYTQVVYYENGDQYKSHTDASLITLLSWFYQEPKKFSGGNLFFPDYDLEIEVKNNRAVIFPSHIYHQVDKVFMEEQFKNKKLGRFCISQFLFNVHTSSLY